MGRTTRAQRIGAGENTLHVAPEVAQEIKRRTAEAEGYSAIAVNLNRRKVPCPIEPQWTVARIRNMMARPRYAGLVAHKGEIVGSAVWPAVLDRPTWNAVQEALAQTTDQRGRQYGSLLGGLAVCLACVPPEPMWCSSWGDKAGSRVYKCQSGHGARRQDVLEEHVLSRVLPAVTEDEIAAKQDAIMVDSQPLRERIVGLELEMTMATESYHASEIRGQDFYPLLARLRRDHEGRRRSRGRIGSLNRTDVTRRGDSDA